MKARRVLFLAILIYVGLDLSLPEMPGAFVFDPDGSVESIHVSRTRLVTRIVVLPAPAIDSRVPIAVLTAHDRHRLAPDRETSRRGRAMVSCLPRAICAASPPPEDPH
ncbi:MAG TPA: hypothetical protein VGM22_27745 [Methylomirabilota bacterium]